MASCFLTSHVEIATTDRVVGGRTIKQGQAIIVSDTQVGGGGGGPGGSQIDICKIAQYVGNKLECVPISNDLSGFTGTDGELFAGLNIFASPTADFIVNGVVVGDFVTISSGAQQGTYRVVGINSNDAVNLDTTFDINEQNLSWALVRNQRGPDYSQVMRALPVSVSPLLPQLRYIPMFGPGDHAGDTMSTTAGSTAVTDVNADFDDLDRPIPTDGTAYIEILTGSDAGFHNITQVSATVLTLSAALNFTANNVQYRVRLVSPHATHVMVSDWGSEKVAIPIQDSFGVKIAGAVRDLADAQALDVASEIPDTTRAVDLFEALGAYIGCHRVKREADQSTGGVGDNRVLIPAMPWWGHEVDGVLFFKAGGQQKYRLLIQNPVLPIRWVDNMYRLEMAIARETAQQPTPGEECV